MSSGRKLPTVDRAGAAPTSSSPLPGTFLELALDLRSDRLYDLVDDIPDVMGIQAIHPSAAIVKVMSVPDSRCVRVVTPDDHVHIGFHEILIHDLEEEELLFVAMSELGCLRLYHMELAQLWRCPVTWCTVWKGTDCVDHMRRAHNIPSLVPTLDSISRTVVQYVTSGCFGNSCRYSVVQSHWGAAVPPISGR